MRRGRIGAARAGVGGQDVMPLGRITAAKVVVGCAV
jgi:hypothetical protein